MRMMKRFLILCSFVAVFLCPSLDAEAQYARKGAKIVDPEGTVLSDQALIDIVGYDIYEQTFVGARRQLKAGRAMILGGVSCIGVGVLGAGAAAGLLILNTEVLIAKKETEKALVDGVALTGLFYLSEGVAIAGGALLTSGIILNTIGKKRIKWVAGQCGTGIALVF